MLNWSHETGLKIHQLVGVRFTESGLCLQVSCCIPGVFLNSWGCGRAVAQWLELRTLVITPWGVPAHFSPSLSVFSLSNTFHGSLVFSHRNKFVTQIHITYRFCYKVVTMKICNFYLLHLLDLSTIFHFLFRCHFIF